MQPVWWESWEGFDKQGRQAIISGYQSEYIERQGVYRVLILFWIIDWNSRNPDGMTEIRSIDVTGYNLPDTLADAQRRMDVLFPIKREGDYGQR